MNTYSEECFHYDLNKNSDKMELWTPEYRLRFVTGELQTKEL